MHGLCASLKTCYIKITCLISKACSLTCTGSFGVFLLVGHTWIGRKKKMSQRKETESPSDMDYLKKLCCTSLLFFVAVQFSSHLSVKSYFLLLHIDNTPFEEPMPRNVQVANQYKQKTKKQTKNNKYKNINVVKMLMWVCPECLVMCRWMACKQQNIKVYIHRTYKASVNHVWVSISGLLHSRSHLSWSVISYFASKKIYTRPWIMLGIPEKILMFWLSLRPITAWNKIANFFKLLLLFINRWISKGQSCPRKSLVMALHRGCLTKGGARSCCRACVRLFAGLTHDFGVYKQNPKKALYPQ